MNVNLEIKPMNGLGELSFGMVAEDVIKIAGPAEEIEKIDDDQVKTTIWHYWTKGLSLFFDEENNLKLSSIEVDNTNATIFGKSAFEMNESEITELMKSNGFNEIDAEEQEWGEKRVSFDDAMVDFYFEEDELVSINYSVFLNEFEIAVWPN
ncbi:MAG: hypothetical protein H0X62_09560 [Bacteroidetes bacterium]|nr:hypothetical protein [Bacteroidota bacterium]